MYYIYILLLKWSHSSTKTFLFYTKKSFWRTIYDYIQFSFFLYFRNTFLWQLLQQTCHIFIRVSTFIFLQNGIVWLKSTYLNKSILKRVILFAYSKWKLKHTNNYFCAYFLLDIVTLQFCHLSCRGPVYSWNLYWHRVTNKMYFIILCRTKCSI